MFDNKMKRSSLCVSISDHETADGSPRYGIKIQMDSAELNILIKLDEIDLFSEVVSASWDKRRSILIGECLGAPVHWCSTSEDVSLLVGDDDETWDIAFTLPKSILQDIQQELRNTK